mmetsp:Transcript_9808/g.22373  ORF Transcript_9808/g.22373 Transcript_9808/m.22373 type:complete len:219 (-) Transcript_9808:460-1116(-)
MLGLARVLCQVRRTVLGHRFRVCRDLLHGDRADHNLLPARGREVLLVSVPVLVVHTLRLRHVLLRGVVHRSSPAVPAHCRSSHQARQRQLHGNMGETAGGRVEHCTYGESTSHGRCHCASGKDTSANPGGHRAGLEGGRLCRALHNEPLSQSRPLAPASLQARAGAGAVPRPAPGTGGGTGRSHEISVPEVGGGVQWFLPHARKDIHEMDGGAGEEDD